MKTFLSNHQLFATLFFFSFTFWFVNMMFMIRLISWIYLWTYIQTCVKRSSSSSLSKWMPIFSDHWNYFSIYTIINTINFELACFVYKENVRPNTIDDEIYSVMYGFFVNINLLATVTIKRIVCFLLFKMTWCRCN